MTLPADLYPGRVRKGLERFASWARSRLLIILAGRLAGGQRALRPTPGWTFFAGPRLSQGMGWSSPSWGTRGQESELNPGRRAPRPLLRERRCTGPVHSGLEAAREPRARAAAEASGPRPPGAPGAPRRGKKKKKQKPQVGAEAGLWAARFPPRFRDQ